ncbi:MAG: peptidase M3, partial [Bacteroidota bacterium]
MRKIFLFLIMAVIISSSCNNQKDNEQIMDNPLLQEWDTPFGVPPFDKIEAAHFMPAFEEGMKRHTAEVEEIIANEEAPTFENTVKALTMSGLDLDRVSAVFSNLNSANTNDSLQGVAEKVYPMLSKHSDDIRMNPELFKRIKTVYDKRKTTTLSTEEAYLLENLYLSFVRSGANLSDEDKETLQKINQDLSSKTLAFGKHVLNETNEYKLVIDDKKDLAGLSKSQIE